eukprot:scaffold16368_cov155-Skeletonema_menzelii.AAC.1
MSSTDDIVATRKLTESETATLRSLLKSQLNIKAGDAQDEEDAGDLLDYAFAMIANGRNVGCVTEELKSMELEVCPAESAQKLGSCLSKFLLDLDGSSRPSSETTPKKESSGKVSNALTNSGALGSARKSNNDSSKNINRNDGRRDGTKQQQRSVHGAAFDRLRNNASNNDNQRNNRAQHHSSDNRGRGGPHRSPMNQSRGQNHHERGNDNGRRRDDLGGRGGGRGGRGHGGGRGESRGGGRGGGGRQNNVSGKRRQRDEEEFVPVSAMDRGLQSSRTGDERQGRGGRIQDMQSHGDKRARYEQQSNDTNYAQQGNDNDNWGSNHWQEQGRGRGGRFSRGGGRFGRGRGHFSNTFYPNKQNTEQEGGDGEANATSEAAAVSESPLVAGHFSGRGSFRGRGRGRGRGRFVDGRGGRAGRAEVADMISAKTWTRPRTMDEGLSASR